MQDSGYHRIGDEIGQRNDMRIWKTTAHGPITEELSLLLESTRIKETPLFLWSKNTDLVSFSTTDDVSVSYCRRINQ